MLTKYLTQLYEQEQHGSNGTLLFGSYVRRWEGEVRVKRTDPVLRRGFEHKFCLSFVV
jgi:hypothetical protein